VESFPFLKLPGELRNRIYEFLLTDTRGPQDFVDPLILVNDLSRRKARREAKDIPPLSTGISKKSKQLAKKYHMLNNGEANMARLKKRVCGLPSLLETKILGVCRQTNTEGTAILFRNNVFAVIVPLRRNCEDVATWFPQGLDISRIQRLRLEVQLALTPKQSSRESIQSMPTWGFLPPMKDLQMLQLLITFEFEPRAAQDKANFERFWHSTPFYRSLMQEVIAAVPKNVKVVMGLTKEEKVRSEYGGYCPVESCVLRKVYKTYGCLQGADVDVEVFNMDKAHTDRIEDYPIDGDDEDSDMEEEEAQR
jgi:hypothetical protein